MKRFQIKNRILHMAQVQDKASEERSLDDVAITAGRRSLCLVSFARDIISWWPKSFVSSIPRISPFAAHGQRFAPFRTIWATSCIPIPFAIQHSRRRIRMTHREYEATLLRKSRIRLRTFVGLKSCRHLVAVGLPCVEIDFQKDI